MIVKGKWFNEISSKLSSLLDRQQRDHKAVLMRLDRILENQAEDAAALSEIKQKRPGSVYVATIRDIQNRLDALENDRTQQECAERAEGLADYMHTNLAELEDTASKQQDIIGQLVDRVVALEADPPKEEKLKRCVHCGKIPIHPGGTDEQSP